MSSLAAGGSWHLGPLHPLSHGQLFVELTGPEDSLAAARLDWARQRRGDEKLLELRDLPQGLALANRAGWLTPSALEFAYAEAAESIIGMAVPARAQALRQVVNAAQQLAGLLLRLAGTAALLDLDPTPFLASRERWLAALEALTGARIHDTFARIGGVAADLTPEVAEQLRAQSSEKLPGLDARGLRGQAKLSASDVAKYGVVGIPAKDHDAADRVEHLGKSAKELPSQILQLLHELPTGAFASPLPKSLRLPVGNATATWPSANGDATVWLHGNGGKAPTRVAITTNAQRAAALFEAVATGRDESDALLLLATLPIAPGELGL